MSDLIDRQTAIDAICKHYTDLERRGITVLAVANHKQVTVDLLEQLPSAQSEITAEQVNEFCAERGLVVLTKEEYHWLKSLKSKAEEFRWNGGGNY